MRARPADDVLLELIPELDEQRALAEGDDARLHRPDDRGLAPSRPRRLSAARTAAAIAGAPGVSPCRQSVSTASFRNVPSCARTPPSRTNESACFAATCGSVCSAPAQLARAQRAVRSRRRGRRIPRARRAGPRASAASTIAEPGGANSATSVRCREDHSSRPRRSPSRPPRHAPPRCTARRAP